MNKTFLVFKFYYINKKVLVLKWKIPFEFKKTQTKKVGSCGVSNIRHFLKMIDLMKSKEAVELRRRSWTCNLASFVKYYSDKQKTLE